jgi:hypothetical protein
MVAVLLIASLMESSGPDRVQTDIPLEADKEEADRPDVRAGVPPISPPTISPLINGLMKSQQLCASVGSRFNLC